MVKILETTDFSIESLGVHEENVYDIEVEKNHNFFANDILLHNSIYVNMEPIIPIMVAIYKPLIQTFLYQKDPGIIQELDDAKFWDNIVTHFEQKSDIVKKYFLPHHIMEGNGFAESCIRFEVETGDKKEMKNFCKINDMDVIFQRRSDKGVFFFVRGDDIALVKGVVETSGLNILSYKRTYILDDFSDALIQEIIDENYKNLSEYLNAKNTMVMKRECICLNGFWLGGKTYGLSVIDSEGVKYNSPETKITGVLSSSTPSKVRDFIKEFISLLLSQKDVKSPESKLVLNKFMDEFSDIFMSLTPEEMAFSMQVNNIESAMDSNGMPGKGSFINSTASIYFNRYIRENDLKAYEPIQEGEKMKYVYLLKPNPFYNAHVIGFKDEGLPKEFWNYVDKHTMLEKTCYEMIKTIMKCTGIEMECNRVNQNIMDFL